MSVNTRATFFVFTKTTFFENSVSNIRMYLRKTLGDSYPLFGNQLLRSCSWDPSCSLCPVTPLYFSHWQFNMPLRDAYLPNTLLSTRSYSGSHGLVEHFLNGSFWLETFLLELGNFMCVVLTHLIRTSIVWGSCFDLNDCPVAAVEERFISRVDCHTYWSNYFCTKVRSVSAFNPQSLQCFFVFVAFRDIFVVMMRVTRKRQTK